MIGFTCGVFDLFHAGHILMLKECKERCSYLIVAIKADPSVDEVTKNKPIQSVLERTIEVGSCKYVDKIYIYETEKDLEVLLGSLDIERRFIGVDHLNKPITGKEICDKRGIKIEYTDRNHEYSTSTLRRRVTEAEISRKL